MNEALDPLRAAMARGRELEARGDVDSAVRAYFEAGLLAELERVLVAKQRHVHAAEMLIAWVSHRPQPLVENDRAWAVRAANLFELTGAAPRAVEVLHWIGAEADGIAMTQRLLEEGRQLEAGACFLRLGESKRGMELLTRTSAADERYALACIEVARGLSRGTPLTMELDRWLADFIRRGPSNEAEADALYAIASAFAREGMPENALECLQQIERRRPGFRDVAAQTRRLEGGTRGAIREFARVLEEDARFQGTRIPTLSAAAPLESLAPDPILPPDDPLAAPEPTSEPATAEMYVPGMIFGGRYRLDELVGRGGMSVVYSATDLELHDAVALKIFTQVTNDDALARFKQEVLLARQLIHRNIIRVYDLGTALGAPFLTMELLRGEDLHGRLTRGLSLRDGMMILAQACAGLEVAHQAGVIHRDIKPENLFITNDNVVKVTDFGIAKQLAQKGLTVAGMVVGTPEYMSPEQANGHGVITARADLYSLGIILYYMTARTLPFMHDDLVPLLMMQVNQRPERPRARNKSLSREVEDLVMDLLEKDPAKRPASARIVGERLLDLVHRGLA